MTYSVEFVVGSDPQYRFYGTWELFKRPGPNQSVNARHDGDHASLRDINALEGIPYPDVFGGNVKQLRGVVVCGDLTDNTSDFELDGVPQYDLEDPWFRDRTAYARHGFKQDFLELCRYPVYEGWGNHDTRGVKKTDYGGVVLKMMRDRNRGGRPDLVRALSADKTAAHYSWFWHPVLCVQCNLYPGKLGSYGRGAYEFIASELTRVGPGIPVIVFFHFHFTVRAAAPLDAQDSFWSTDEQKAFLALIAPYNVVAIFHGHTHANPLTQYEVTAGTRTVPVFDVGQISAKEYAVVRIIPEAGDTGLEASGSRPVPYRLQVAARNCNSDGVGTWKNGTSSTYHWEFSFEDQGGHNVDSSKVAYVYGYNNWSNHRGERDLLPTPPLHLSAGDLVSVRVSFTAFGTFYWKIASQREEPVIQLVAPGGGLVAGDQRVSTGSEALFLALQDASVPFNVQIFKEDFAVADSTVYLYRVTAEVIDSGLTP